MRRRLVLGALIVVGGLSLGIRGFEGSPLGPPIEARQQPFNVGSPAALAATKIEKVKENLYIITGSSPGAAEVGSFSGGNTAVFITDAGVTVVDTKVPGWGQAILDRIKTVTDKPVTRIINTHSHLDHAGSNGFFGTTVETVVHENATGPDRRVTTENMAKIKELFKEYAATVRPKRTYKDKLTLGGAKDQIDLYYFGRGHTNGDTFVVFPALRTMHVGDMFAWKALPFIDPENGGSVVEHPQSLAKAIATVKNVDTIISGHIPVGTWDDLKEFADFTQDFVDWARNEMKAGKTVDEAAAEYKVPAKYKGYVPSVHPQVGGAKTNLQIAYGEMTK